MSGDEPATTVAPLPDGPAERTRLPRAATRLVWLLWVGSLAALAAGLEGGAWELDGLLRVDGLTLVTWVVVTFLSGVVHSYARRYMRGTPRVERFFGLTLAFTLAVGLLVAADHAALFLAAWLAMGLAMAGLVGHVRGWPQARAAARTARRYFLAGGGLLAVALGTLWWATGAATVSGMAAGAGGAPRPAWLVAAGAIVLAAAVQSALVPFHGWLLGSMTAPTPASALMHAGFVNAGGILLVRFAPTLTVEPGVLLAVAAVGAASALGGKLLKSVQPDVKRQLGCSTVGQMGFMLMQAGLGFFGAAVAHLALHGFYKAYLFLAAGSGIERTAPPAEDGGHGPAGRGGVAPGLLALGAALAGGALFAVLTGKGTSPDGGVVLTLLVGLATYRASRGALARRSLPAGARYGAVALVLLAVALYAAAYAAVTRVMTAAGVPVVTAPAALTPVHAAVAGGFLLAYLAVETGAYRHSDRLYVALVNATEPPADTLLTAPEEYDEH